MLIAGCRFSVTPNEELSNLTLTLAITESNPPRLLTNATTVNSFRELADAIIVYNEMQRVVSPTCQITSLEVYRGRDQVTMIRHGGFSLSISGMIEVSIMINLKPINCAVSCNSQVLLNLIVL